MLRDLLDALCCPACMVGALDGIDAAMPDGDLRCTSCGAHYPVRSGIPILLPPGFDAASLHDELDHAHGHKHDQAGYYDREVAEEFEVTRPHASPRAYGWLLDQKFRRSIANLPGLRGATVVDACCGSGMDAEMLTRAGARVLAIDISEGCVRRAQERARRFGVDYAVVVGDVERLPVRTGGVDFGYVHDGLHHLADPAAGVRELARVARRGVSINEPADALGTALAVRLGLSIAYEDAGNRVARLRASDVQRALGAGYDVRALRYLMYYRHEPGTLMRLASRAPLAPAYRAAATIADRAIGRWGNKLQVTAVRRDAA